MSPPGRDGDGNDDKRTIGRKRPYPSSDENADKDTEIPSQSEAADESGSSSERWSSNHASSSQEPDALQQGFDTSRGVQSASDDEVRAPGPVLEPPGVGGSLQNPSFLVSASSEANYNNSSSDVSSNAARPALNSQFHVPGAPAFNDPFVFNQGIGGLDQAQVQAQLQAQLQAQAQSQLFPPGLAAAATAGFGGGPSPELMNLYQLNLIQLMNSQPGLRATQGALNSAIPSVMPHQAAVNPYFAGNLFSRLLYQQAMAVEAQRVQLAGLMSEAPPFALAASMGGGAVARGAAATSVASLPNFAHQGVYRGPVQPTKGPLLYMPSDDDILSDQQILIRKQIELFAADSDDVSAVTPGRRKQILLGQVGIRCRYCAHIPIHHRTKGAVYYPAKLKGIYQAAQNMAASHFCDACDNIDPFLKAELQAYQQAKSSSGHGGKQYWADSARVLGVIETEDGGLRFDPNRKYNKKTGKAEKR